MIFSMALFLSFFQVAMANDIKRNRELISQEKKRSFQRTHNQRELKRGIKRVMKKRLNNRFLALKKRKEVEKSKQLNLKESNSFFYLDEKSKEN
jgi:hypothetical protein